MGCLAVKKFNGFVLIEIVDDFLFQMHEVSNSRTDFFFGKLARETPHALALGEGQGMPFMISSLM